MRRNDDGSNGTRSRRSLVCLLVVDLLFLFDLWIRNPSINLPCAIDWTDRHSPYLRSPFGTVSLVRESLEVLEAEKGEGFHPISLMPYRK